MESVLVGQVIAIESEGSDQALLSALPGKPLPQRPQVKM